MQLETSYPFCSLCKRELTSYSFESGPVAKLCEECRGLIRTAFRRDSPQAIAASAGVLPLSGIATYVQSNGSAVSCEQAPSPRFFDDFSAHSDTSAQSKPAGVPDVDHESFEMHFEDEPSAEIESEANSLDAVVLESTEHQTFFSEEQPAAIESESQFLDVPALESTDHQDETLVAMAPSSESDHSELSELHTSLADIGNDAFADFSKMPAVPDEQVPEEVQNTLPVTETAPADPWEDPLPAWDYSRAEWPVLMGPPRERSFAKFKLPAALLLILALGAGFYYLIYPQISRDQPPADNAVLPERAVESLAPAHKPAEPVAQSQAPSTSSDAPASEQAQPQQNPVREASAATETSNAKGRFALQAAAFPTQAGADELAQKLKSAGVPSYVVSADLPRRGTWFRVRVGRFNTAEDAQRFAGEAQLRAKSAGMSLQLIVSQYEQP